METLNVWLILNGLVIQRLSTYLVTRGWQEVCFGMGTVSVRARDGRRDRGGLITLNLRVRTEYNMTNTV